MFQVQVHGIMENPFFFTVVSKLASRIVLFYWYWYRLLNFWYRDTPTTHTPHTPHTHTVTADLKNQRSRNIKRQTLSCV